MIDEIADIETVKDLKEKVRKILTDVKIMAVGMSTFGIPEAKWDFLCDKYYEQIKEAFLLEQEIYKNKLHREEAKTIQ